MKKNLVSVIMTAYNAEKFIQQSIDSVLGQTYQEIELIIVDDGSTDRTNEIIRKNKDDRIRLITLPENRHIAHATNQAYPFINGEFTAIMDSDDLWMPDKLEKQVHFLQEHPEYRACFTWMDIINEEGRIVSYDFYDLLVIYSCHTDTREEWMRYFAFAGNRLNNPSSLICTDTMKEIGLHNPIYIQGHDYEFWVRYTMKYAFAIIEEPLMRYRRIVTNNGSTSARNIENDRRFQNEQALIRYNMVRNMSDKDFVKAFREDLIYKENLTSEMIMCERALLLKRIFTMQQKSILGMKLLEELFADPEYEALLQEKYHVNTISCKGFTGEQLLFNQPEYESMTEEILNLKTQVQELTEVKHNQEKDIEGLRNENAAIREHEALLSDDLSRIQFERDEMLHSTSWRVTEPFRNIMQKIHK